MRLNEFIANVISEIQVGIGESLFCEDFNVEFDIAVTDADDEEGIHLAVTLPNDTGNRISFSVPIRSFKSFVKGGNS